MPLISVIIPNNNHASYLKQRIDSVLNQTYSDFELIILDDGSTDNSLEIIEQYRSLPKISHIVYNEKNSGSPFRQWIKGISLAKGDWIWIAESDDYAHPSFIETLVRHSTSNATAGILYCNSNKESFPETGVFKTTADESNFDFRTTFWNQDHLLKGNDAISLYLSKKNFILNVSSTLIQKEYLIQSLPELRSMKYYGDWYAYICMAAQADIFYCKDILNTFRRHPLSLIVQSDLKKVKIDCFKILCLLLKQRNINQSTTIVYFTNTYFGAELKKEGLLSFLKTVVHYFFINPLLAVTVIAKILQSKMTKNP